jgi:sugar-specific transcriptional regulator TrmB
MLEENLKTLGLTPNETKVYLAILQFGKLTHPAIAKITKIKRTTVYNIVGTLLEKNLIAEDLAGAAAQLSIRPIEVFSYIVRKEEQATEKKKRAVAELLPQLQNLSGLSKYEEPKINFVDEDNLEKYLYQHNHKWDASAMKYDGCAWGFQDKTFVKHYEKWIDWYWEEGGHTDMQYRLLSNTSAEIIKKKKFERRHIKNWPGSEDFSATTWILGDYIISIVTSQRPHHLVETNDPILAANLRAIFKKVWTDLK